MKKITKNLIALFVAVAMLPACSDDTVDLLNENHYVGVSSELYSGLWGLVADVAKVADQAPILEGLRGGMIEPTENATSDMMDIYNYANLDNNEIANPAGYYRIINGVDDYVKRVDEFRKNDSTALDFEHQYNVTFDLYISTAVRYKVWAYLQLAKFYGGAKVQGEWKNFDQVIDLCIELMTQNITYGSNGMNAVRWRNFLAPDISIPDDRNLQQYDCYQFTPWTLLTELYLWKGDYLSAYTYATEELDNAGFIGNCYQISLHSGNYGEWKYLFRCSNKDKSSSEFLRIETITNASYSPRQGEADRLEDYASTSNLCHYYIRPTLKGMARFDTISVAPYNDSYRGRNGTYSTRNGVPELAKWIDVKPVGKESEESNIALYRAAHLHLMLCEALTGLALEAKGNESLQGAYIEAALALINDGIGKYWNTDNNAYQGCFAQINQYNNAHNPGVPAFSTTLHGASDYLNVGLRGRVQVSPVGTDFIEVDTLGVYTMPMDMTDRIWKVDSLLSEEVFFELSGEGHVMPIFYRMMKRHEKDQDQAHKDFFTKFIAAGRSEIEAKLQTDENWFLDYNIK